MYIQVVDEGAEKVSMLNISYPLNGAEILFIIVTTEKLKEGWTIELNVERFEDKNTEKLNTWRK